MHKQETTIIATMVFGLIRKDDANFQTLDESCAFSCFDDNETSETTSSPPKEPSGVQHFNSKNLLSSGELSDNLDEDSDSNLLDELMPYLHNNTKKFVRAPSMDKESHGESEPAARIVVRAPSMDMTNSFIRYGNGEASDSSDSLDELDIHDRMEIVQLELTGIATVTTTGTNNTQNSLDGLLKYEDQETKDAHRSMEASIAFTTCFELTAEEIVVKLEQEPILLTMGSVSVEIDELVSLGIVAMGTAQKIQQHLTQKRRDKNTSVNVTTDKSVDETVRRRGRRRDSQNQATGNPAMTDTMKEAATFVAKPAEQCNTGGVGDRLLEPMERRRSNFSSPDRKKAQDEKAPETKNVAVPSESRTSVPKRRANPERRSSSKESLSGKQSGTTQPTDSKRSIDSSSSKTKSRATSSSDESQNRSESVSSRISNDAISVKRPKARRSNSLNSVESFNRADYTSNRICIENSHSSGGNQSQGAEASRKNSSMNELDDKIIYDISSPVSSKKQISKFGNKGNKMIKFLSNRYLCQEKERPTLVKAESQSILSSPRGLEHSSPDNKNTVSAKDVTEFKGHLVDGTVPFTPRSQKRFLNWRTMGLKKTSTSSNTNKHLIEGELDVLENDSNDENSLNEATNIGSELTVQNLKKNSVNMDRESKEASDVVRKVTAADNTARGSITGERKKVTKLNHERSSIYASSRHEQYLQREDKDTVLVNGKSRQNQSPAKSVRSTNKTPPKKTIVRKNTSEHHSNPKKELDREAIGNSDHSLQKRTTADVNSAIQCMSLKEEIVSECIPDCQAVSSSHDYIKSPTRRRSSMSRVVQSTSSNEEIVSDSIPDCRADSSSNDYILSPTRRRASISRGLSQSVHIHASPTKKLGKGSSTGVTRRQRLIAATFLDDLPSSLSSTDNHVLTHVSNEMCEPIVDNEKKGQRTSSDLGVNMTTGDLVCDSRPPKNLSRSMHVSSPRKKVGDNIEISVGVNHEMSSKSKVQSKGSPAIDTEAGADDTEKKSEHDSKPTVSTRIRKTTCKEFTKEFAVEPVEDEPVVVESTGRRRRNSIGMSLKF